MKNITINGSHNIVGNRNMTHTGIGDDTLKELIQVIKASASSEAEREQLLSAVDILNNKTADLEERKSSWIKVRDFLIVVGGPVAADLLVRLGEFVFAN